MAKMAKTAKAADKADNKIKSDKILRYSLMGIAIAGVIAYIIFTAMPEKKPGKENNMPDVSQAPSQTSEILTAAPVGPDLISDEDPDINDTDDMDGRVKLYAERSKNKNVIACYVYEPVGYDIAQNPLSVTLTPSDMDLTVTGNSPLMIRWSSMANLNTVMAEGSFEDPKIGYYETVHKYRCAAHSDLEADAYVIKQTPYDDESTAVYVITLDIPHNGLRPMLIIPESSIHTYLTARYPDIRAFAEAIFIPAEAESESANENAEAETPKSAETEAPGSAVENNNEGDVEDDL